MRRVEVNELKETIRAKIEANYGGVSKFLRSEDGQKFGGMKIKPYLYNGGPTSIEPLCKLAKFFGLGTITKKVVVSRKVEYYVSAKD